MLKPAAFRDEAVQAVLERAATVAGMPLALHYLDGAQESPRILGWNQCAVCAQVAALPGGRQSCRASRVTAARMAVDQERPIPFVCHMGLACVTVPAVAGESYVLTFGPFAPKGASASMEHDAAAGLRELTGEDSPDTLASLEDLHVTPLDAVPALATWTVASLATVLADRTIPEVAEAPVAEPPPAPPRRTPRGEAYQSRLVEALAVAAIGGDFDTLRTALTREIRTMERTPALRTTTLLTLTSAIHGAMLRANLVDPDHSKDFEALATELSGLTTSRGQVNRIVGFFRSLRKGDVQQNPVQAGLEQMNRLIGAHLPEGLPLGVLAEQLGETPSAITHRLQRKFNLSYTEYVGFRRIEAAKTLLLDSPLGIAQIGRRVGINDQSNFARLFKRVEGVTPAQFRRNQGKGPK